MGNLSSILTDSDNSTCTFNSGSSSLQPSILTQAQSLRNQARQYQLEAKAASELSQVEYRFGYRCRSANLVQLTVITGMGNHSPNKIAKIKPEVE
ncbi:unnamed protein product, partial [Rotaria sordida]